MNPGQAIVLASVFNLLGPVLAGAAVADTIGGIVTADSSAGAIEVIGSGVAAAVIWNLITWWRGLPSSSGHALVGGLVGAALVQGGADAVHWGGFEAGRPIGVLGTLVALAVSPLLGGLAALVILRCLRRAARRATHGWAGLVRSWQWAASAGLAFSHGANDAQKAVGIAAALLVADGHLTSLAAPVWLELACAAALTAGTAAGGWRIIRTIGRRIYRIRSLDALAGETAAGAVVLGASAVGAPVSTTQVVASSVVGVGGARGRWHHVRWTVVSQMGLAWIVTLPATAALAAAVFGMWSSVS
jgi:PiT family inorganic phosphate transporter